MNNEDRIKTLRVSEKTWELLTLIKTIKKMHSIDEVIDHILKKAKIDPEKVKDFLEDIEGL